MVAKSLTKESPGSGRAGEKCVLAASISAKYPRDTKGLGVGPAASEGSMDGGVWKIIAIHAPWWTLGIYPSAKSARAARIRQRHHRRGVLVSVGGGGRRIAPPAGGETCGGGTGQDRGPMASVGVERGEKPKASVQAQGKGDRTAEPKAGPLTTREAEILMLVAAGHPDKRIADSLGISEETVAYHLRVMFDHNGVHSRAGLVATLAHLLPKG